AAMAGAAWLERGEDKLPAWSLRLSFAQVDVDGLELELPIPDGQREPPRVVLRNARRLAGRIVQGPGHLRVDRVTAEQLGLDALRLVFGLVVLSEEGKAVLEGVSCTFDRKDEVELDLEAAVVRTHRLTVEIPGFSIGARASFRDLSIAAQGAEGSFEAEALHLESFVIQAGKVRIEAPRIEAERQRLLDAMSQAAGQGAPSMSPKPGMPRRFHCDDLTGFEYLLGGQHAH
ncbi:MAG: hypothetical protein KDI56_05050, partial [Xanthomonadales bacterium]|nr:hypothetical protein [Xanthomonadales bacterium]